MTERKFDEKTQKLLLWNESLTIMQDNRFFEIIRTYVGEFKTPFNKNRLIEKLNSFFRNEENQETIISFLSDFDIKMLTAIEIIGNLNQSKLVEFFTGDYLRGDIYSEILNLQERLLIFSYKDLNSCEVKIAINPLLSDALLPFIKIENLFQKSNCVSKSAFISAAPFELSPQFLAAFVTYVKSNPTLCKNDLSIKKKDVLALEQIFPNQQKICELLLKAFLNLEILRIGKSNVFFDSQKLTKFADLPEIQQCVFLSVCSEFRFSRQNLQKYAQLLLNLGDFVPSQGFLRSDLIKMAFILSNKNLENSQSKPLNRFAKILESYNYSDCSEQKQPENSSVLEVIVDSAIEFGFFVLLGTDENGEKIYIPKKQETFQNPKILNITAGTTITIMPGLNLAELLPFTEFTNILSCSTAIEFEITKKSVARAFDKNITPTQIYNLLKEYFSYELPQILKVNIEEWYNSYSAAMLFKGYVLKVDEKMSRIIEKNPKIEPFIQTQLGQGIFLLNIPIEDDAKDFIESCGLEFMGDVKISSAENDVADFPILQMPKLVFEKRTNLENQVNSAEQKNVAALVKTGLEKKRLLHKKLNSLELTNQQRECLSDRIDRNVIISESQLNAHTVRLELLEADGMNYSGKFHIVENAVKNSDCIEVTIPSEAEDEKNNIFLGKPISVSKNTNDAFVRIELDDTKEIKFFSISKAKKIKLIKTSIFD